jgi:aryl-alcohol dehydrogenase-like predicted oxidoreductase
VKRGGFATGEEVIVGLQVSLLDFCNYLRTSNSNRMKGPTTKSETALGGRFTFLGTSLTVQRMGYGAMQLAGPGVWGPPKDPDGAVAVLREAVAAGVNHIDTSDFYGPNVTNQIIRRALHPYPTGMVIVTKLGARRPADKSWQPAITPQDLTTGVYDNLRNLGLEVLDIVADRLGSTPMQVALAWLLHRSPNILLIPGTSSVAHLRENLAAGQLTLSPETLAELDGIAGTPAAMEH